MSSEQSNKVADEELKATGSVPAAASDALADDGKALPAAAAEAEEEEEDLSEVVPVVHSPLSRASAVPTEAEVAAKKAAEPQGPIDMDWYILKVQSNRERSIADALKRKVAIEGLERYVDVENILVPTEKVTEFKGGKKKVVERKLYPGYIVVRMHINDDSWFAIRETSGIGDFTGAGGKPSPMLAHEVARIVQTDEEESDDAPKLDIKFKTGDRVKVKDGTFEGFEGEVGTIDAQSGKVQVMISIFGRSTPVELEYWQVEGV